MKAKVIDYSQEKIIAGVKKAADAIKVTLGPSGKGVAIADYTGNPEITRDGATVAKSIVLADAVENMGAQLVRKAATRTEDLAGDSTSTTSILIKEFCIRGQKAVQTGSNVNEIKSGMLKAGKWMDKYIQSKATPINGDLQLIGKVATVSANNDPEIGDLVVQGMQKVGIDGLLTVDAASGLDTVIDITTGMKLNKGWAAPQYVTNPAEGTCVMENPYIMVVGEKLSNVNQIGKIAQEIMNTGRPVLIICDSIDDVVNTTLILNTLRGALRCCVVSGIEFGDNRKNVMNDIAVATGATYITPEVGLDIMNVTLADLGSANKVVVSRDETIIYEGSGDPQEIQNLADNIRARLNDPGISDYDKTKFEKRLAGLVGGIAIIKVGGATEAEKVNRKKTADDAVLAAKSALAEGFVPGGGYVYFTAKKEAEKDKTFWNSLSGDEVEGAKIVFSSLPVIMWTIADNSGASADVILSTQAAQKKENVGYNAKTKKFENLIDSGILDSAKCIRVALENAISTAAMILLIDCTIIDEEKKEEE